MATNVEIKAIVITFPVDDNGNKSVEIRTDYEISTEVGTDTLSFMRSKDTTKADATLTKKIEEYVADVLESLQPA